MSWICPCGTTNRDGVTVCRWCSRQFGQVDQRSTSPTIHIHQITNVIVPKERRGGCCGCIVTFFILALIAGAVERACPSGNNEQGAWTDAPVSEQVARTPPASHEGRRSSTIQDGGHSDIRAKIAKIVCIADQN
jgi:hypothetical protein